MLHNVCISAVAMSLRRATRGPWASCFALMAFCLAERHHFSILVEGHSRNIPVKLFQNSLTGLGGDVF